MAKRIQMRKNRILALQKIANEKKMEAMMANNANAVPGGNGEGPTDNHGIPKQTVSHPERAICPQYSKAQTKCERLSPFERVSGAWSVLRNLTTYSSIVV